MKNSRIVASTVLLLAVSQIGFIHSEVGPFSFSVVPGSIALTFLLPFLPLRSPKFRVENEDTFVWDEFNEVYLQEEDFEASNIHRVFGSIKVHAQSSNDPFGPSFRAVLRLPIVLVGIILIGLNLVLKDRTRRIT